MSTLAEQFELLVDGELDESQRTQLLQSLDAEPDGWKQCSLTFLEDQTLRTLVKNDPDFAVSSLPVLPPEESVERFQTQTPQRVFATENRSFFHKRSVASRVTLAASCLMVGLAFGLAIGAVFWESENHFETPGSSIAESSSILAVPPVSKSPFPTVPETQLVSFQSPSYAGLHPMETFLPKATVLISNRGEPLIPQHRQVSLRPGSSAEKMTVPCFDNGSVNPSAFSKMFQDASLQVKSRCKHLGKNVRHKISYQIINGQGAELILIPSQDIEILFEEIDNFE